MGVHVVGREVQRVVLDRSPRSSLGRSAVWAQLAAVMLSGCLGADGQAPETSPTGALQVRSATLVEVDLPRRKVQLSRASQQTGETAKASGLRPSLSILEGAAIGVDVGN